MATDLLMVIERVEDLIKDFVIHLFLDAQLLKVKKVFWIQIPQFCVLIVLNVIIWRSPSRILELCCHKVLFDTFTAVLLLTFQILFSVLSSLWSLWSWEDLILKLVWETAIRYRLYNWGMFLNFLADKKFKMYSNSLCTWWLYYASILFHIYWFSH